MPCKIHFVISVNLEHFFSDAATAVCYIGPGAILGNRDSWSRRQQRVDLCTPELNLFTVIHTPYIFMLAGLVPVWLSSCKESAASAHRKRFGIHLEAYLCLLCCGFVFLYHENETDSYLCYVEVMKPGGPFFFLFPSQYRHAQRQWS